MTPQTPPTPRTPRRQDGSAGDVDYGVIGTHYSRYRQPDARIEAAIRTALGDARTVLNVGAGTGSYEPLDRDVTAVEPSASMRSQRAAHLAQAIDAVAEQLPFAQDRFDASMATFTLHQWSDVERGLREMRRVTSGPVVILTCDPAEVERFWLNDYVPDVLRAEARRYPSIESLVGHLAGRVDIVPLAIPLDCRDGFNEAYYGRPEMFLDPAARGACSAWTFVDDRSVASGIATLEQDLRSGAWDAKHGVEDGAVVRGVASPGRGVAVTGMRRFQDDRRVMVGRRHRRLLQLVHEALLRDTVPFEIYLGFASVKPSARSRSALRLTANSACAASADTFGRGSSIDAWTWARNQVS